LATLVVAESITHMALLPSLFMSTTFDYMEANLDVLVNKENLWKTLPQLGYGVHRNGL
jgi:hypothetical protein